MGRGWLLQLPRPGNYQDHAALLRLRSLSCAPILMLTPSRSAPMGAALNSPVPLLWLFASGCSASIPPPPHSSWLCRTRPIAAPCGFLQNAAASGRAPGGSQSVAGKPTSAVQSGWSRWMGNGTFSCGGSVGLSEGFLETSQVRACALPQRVATTWQEFSPSLPWRTAMSAALQTAAGWGWRPRAAWFGNGDCT